MLLRPSVWLKPQALRTVRLPWARAWSPGFWSDQHLYRVNYLLCPGSCTE